MQQNNLMPCGCDSKQCANWLVQNGLQLVPDAALANTTCLTCSIEGPFAKEYTQLGDFRKKVIEGLDPIKDCELIVSKFAQLILNEFSIDAGYGDEFLNEEGHALRMKIGRGNPIETYQYGRILMYDLDNEDIEPEVLHRSAIYWYACAAVDGYSRAIRELGYAAEGIHECGNDFFTEDAENIPSDDVVANVCFYVAALKGDPQAVDRVCNHFIHSPVPGNEDYVIALKLMGPFANCVLTSPQMGEHYDIHYDRMAIKKIQETIDYGIQDKEEMSDVTKWSPWEHPFAIAICSENGWRVPKDIAKAISNYHIAAELGCKAAVEALKRIQGETQK